MDIQYLVLSFMGLIAFIIGVFKFPEFMKPTLIQLGKKYESEIVLGSYNLLPAEIKAKIDSETFAKIIAIGLQVGDQILTEIAEKKLPLQ